MEAMQKNEAIEAYEAGDFEKAAQLGLVTAWTKLGLAHQQKGEIKEAMEWFISAAMKGETQAQALVTYVSNNVLATTLNDQFRSLDTDKQQEVIEKIIAIEIAPALLKDGGGIEFVHYIPGETPQIWLHYLGACSGCHLSSTSTADMIIKVLEKRIDQHIALILL
jgi:Fe-S cluster biogenesis protein NfuA